MYCADQYGVLFKWGFKKSGDVRKGHGCKNKERRCKVTLAHGGAARCGGAAMGPRSVTARSLPGTLREDLLPYLGQTLIYLRRGAPAANDQLKLAYFFTFVRQPAALAQLRICEERKRRTKKVSHSFLLITSPPFFVPLFFEKKFYTYSFSFCFTLSRMTLYVI